MWKSPSESQCTFWCSVLSDLEEASLIELARVGLNAPFGAQCFPTLKAANYDLLMQVSMHLLALSAFRLVVGKLAQHTGSGLNEPFGAQCFPTGLRSHGSRCRPVSQCTFWCSVLSDQGRHGLTMVLAKSQCTFWCSVLSDFPADARQAEFVIGSQCTFWCSVLSDAGMRSFTIWISGSQCTFWCSVLSDSLSSGFAKSCWTGLNAPFGAQCFPTVGKRFGGGGFARLNAPFGAQCFPTSSRLRATSRSLSVSMHLLVLSAFRRRKVIVCPRCWRVSMHLLVLSAFRRCDR